MMSRPARYSAAVAGSRGCAGPPGVSVACTTVSVITNLLDVCNTTVPWPVSLRDADLGPGYRRLLVGDDRANPVTQVRDRA